LHCHSDESVILSEVEVDGRRRISKRNKMEKVIRKISLKDKHNYDLQFWLSKTPEERGSAMEILRQQFYETVEGSTPRLQRVIKFINREQQQRIFKNKKASGRLKDLANIESLSLIQE
jgi:hypothetical protein